MGSLSLSLNVKRILPPMNKKNVLNHSTFILFAVLQISQNTPWLFLFQMPKPTNIVASLFSISCKLFHFILNFSLPNSVHRNSRWVCLPSYYPSFHFMCICFLLLSLPVCSLFIHIRPLSLFPFSFSWGLFVPGFSVSCFPGSFISLGLVYPLGLWVMVCNPPFIGADENQAFWSQAMWIMSLIFYSSDYLELQHENVVFPQGDYR